MTLLILSIFLIIFLWYSLFWKSADLSKIYKNKPIYFGHRGLRHYAPENTIGSYLKAIKEGLFALELDVRITKDNKLICSHNIDLERESLGSGFVDETHSKDISQTKTGRQFSEKEQETIPLFEKILETIPNHILLNIEIKSDSFYDIAAARELIKILKTKNIKQPIIVSSFNPLVVRYIKFKVKDVPTGYIYEYAKHFSGVFIARPDCLHPDAEFVDDDLLKFCQKRKMTINTWTVNNRDAAEWLINKGVQGIITDNPQITN
jgi:glycerophosphoryl diester phosphodiesterase